MTSLVLMLSVACLGQQAPRSEAGYRSDQVIVHGGGTEDFEVQTLGEMLDALLRSLAEEFGLETPQLEVRFEPNDPHNHVLLTADGKMSLRFESPKKYRPATLNNIPFTRMLTRAVVRWHLTRTMKSPYGLPEGLLDGFAQYLGDTAISQVTQVGALPGERSSPAAARYRKLLADLDAAVGRSSLSFALVALANSGAEGFRYLAVFREAVASAVGEDAIKSVFPAELAASPLGFALGERGMPLDKNPSLLVSSRRVANGIPLLEIAGERTTEAERVATFDGIWQYVKDRYPDPSLKAVDWSGAYDQLRPLVSLCENDVDFYVLVRQLLATLRDPNTRLMHPTGAMYFHLPLGIQIDLIGESLVVSEVTDGSPAAQRGVKRGMLVSEVDGVDAGARLEQFAELQRLWEGITSDRQRRSRAANQLLAGPPKSEAKIVFTAASGEKLAVTLPREDLQTGGGGASAPKGPLESRVLDSNIGYVKINGFADGLGGQFAAAIDAMPKLKALLIDVRASQTGPQATRFAVDCLSKLVSTPAIAGNWQMRNKENVNLMPQRLVPAQNPYGGPVILLVDEWSFGTAEVFAVMLRTMGRARIVGTQTAGAHYDPRELAVPMGQAHAIMSTVSFVPPIPLLVEGYGVPPDIAVQKSLEDVRGGRDPILDKAIELARRL